jgi:hypothetical protein
MFPSDRVAQLHPQAPGSRFVAFYISQGYAGGTATLLHTGPVTDILEAPEASVPCCFFAFFSVLPVVASIIHYICHDLFLLPVL